MSDTVTVPMTWELYDALKTLTIRAEPPKRKTREWLEARQRVASWIDDTVTPAMAKESA